MSYETTVINSLGEYISRIERESVSFFYRGQSQDWPLLPSIARVGRGGYEELIEFEHEIISEFRRLSFPFFERHPDSFSEWILHAQHYGLPTRLLDWTSNPMKALYFAVEDLDEGEDAVVWSWDSADVQWGEELPNLKTTSLYFHRPTHHNHRITSQESMFLVYPLMEGQTKIKPLQESFFKNAPRGELIEKMIIPKEKKVQFKRTLDDLGINRLTIYPCIESVVTTIKNEYYM